MLEEELWHVKRVTAQEYEEFVPDRRNFFNEPRFTELNKYKVDDIYYVVLMRGESARFGLIIGKSGNEAKCPFSAPYSYPVAIINESKQESIDAALAILEQYLFAEGIRDIRYVFPPLFYDEHLLSGWISAFYRSGYTVANLDLSYALNLDKLNVEEEAYGNMITAKGRKALRRARRSGLEIIKCESEKDFREAYKIIEIGHEFKGFPVRLTFEQLSDTLKLVAHDAFIVKKDGIGIVAEYLYRVNDKIVQGIYTGTHPDYMDCSGMNLLTWHTILYYGGLGYKMLDKATATENSEPNYGLCNFKESVGCERSLKYTFYKELI
ncbi:MAG: hypothetical protein J6A08_09610 [Lachnospiraceae bacterium]|nr:hypothetical protein [Lachnospiraceae bacterium]